MKRFLILVFSIFLFSYAEEENIVSHTNIIPEEVQKSLGIKSVILKPIKVSITKIYPAVVKDDLTLSEKIYSPVEGIVKKLPVKEGDKVRKGQAVAYIYSPEIAKLLIKIKEAKVNYEALKKLYEREKLLYENKLITYTRYFSSKIKLENTKAKLDALKQSLKVYGEIKDNLLVLKTSMKGYIAKQNVVLGESVGLDKMIFKIHSHDRLWTVAYVPVSEINLIKENQEATIISPIGRTKGLIDFISHSVDEKTKRVEVRVISDNKNETLKPNMFVDVEMVLGEEEGLFIPVSAVVKTEEGLFVFVKKGNSFNPVKVVLGERVKNYYKLIKGLKEGDEIIVEGVVHLKAKFFGEAEE
jgi:cobalt-zinc-cadmium efflux system membrane fusion protein